MLPDRFTLKFRKASLPKKLLDTTNVFCYSGLVSNGEE